VRITKGKDQLATYQKTESRWETARAQFTGAC
jgi:hypothetical protein